jgi:hypothetical protein
MFILRLILQALSAGYGDQGQGIGHAEHAHAFYRF